MKTIYVLVRVPVPNGVSNRQVYDYVKTAVLAWRGSLAPYEPLFAVADRWFSFKRVSRKTLTRRYPLMSHVPKDAE